jgi:pimeloyl-ACP methyl ester carboxylesterase
MPADVQPFRIDIPETDLDDLRERLARTRWPEAETVDDWSQGLPLAYARDLCRYWADEYDWRATEARLNEFPQFRTELDGLGIHFLHVRSPHPDALPLVITHGWPGSIVEFHKVIGPLTDPGAHGGDPADAFHVVCPSLPGFGFSDRPDAAGWSKERIADAWDVLMDRLGYDHYGAQGGDWGSGITVQIGRRHAERVAGIHLTLVPAIPDPALGAFTAAEEAALADLEYHRKQGSGYSAEQSTRPQTLGYGLVDSPAGQCAWIVEKFREWTDCGGHPENVLTRDEILDNVMLYWLTATGASSARIYWESFGSYDFDPITVPVGASIFPKEIFRPSRRWAEPQFPDLRHWHELDKGGHFASLEVPGSFVDELRTFFRLVR